MFLIPAIILYILTSTFSAGSESNIRWKILALSVAWIVAGQLSNQLISRVESHSVWMLTLSAIGCQVIMLFGLWLELVHWCHMEKRAAMKVTVSFFGALLVLFIGVWYLTRNAA